MRERKRGRGREREGERKAKERYIEREGKRKCTYTLVVLLGRAVTASYKRDCK